MKVSVITLQGIRNYGSVLQAFATQELFKEYVSNVEVINYTRPDCADDRALLELWTNGNIVKKAILYPTVKKWNKVFDGFLKKNLNLTDKKYVTEEDFKDFPLDSDYYCTGSDQVWNSVWNKGIVLPLFLNFVPKDKYKFAYAASFGVDKITDEEIMETKDYINQYNCISVREDSAVDILVNQYCYDNDKVVHLLDPTVAMSREFWSKYEGKSKIKEDYILIYNLNRSKEFDKYAKKLSKKTGLKLVRFCTRYDQFYRPGKSMLVPEVFDFITLISNAKYVLTDSFHATAFSMNMNTEPICVYPNRFGGRLRSFLELTDSLQRHISDYSDFDVVNRKVDFEKVNTILNKERQKTRNFLEKVFGSKSGENNEK